MVVKGAANFLCVAISSESHRVVVVDRLGAKNKIKQNKTRYLDQSTVGGKERSSDTRLARLRLWLNMYGAYQEYALACDTIRSFPVKVDTTCSTTEFATLTAYRVLWNCETGASFAQALYRVLQYGRQLSN